MAEAPRTPLGPERALRVRAQVREVHFSRPAVPGHTRT